MHTPELADLARLLCTSDHDILTHSDRRLVSLVSACVDVPKIFVLTSLLTIETNPYQGIIQGEILVWYANCTPKEKVLRSDMTERQ